MSLRDYQREAHDAIQGEFNDVDSTLLVLPTGCGKTHVFAQLAADWDGRVLVSCPMLELVDQTAKKIYQVTGEEPAIEQATRRSRERTWDRKKFVVGSRSTLISPRPNGKKRFHRLQDISLLIIDEAHLGVNTRGQEMVDHFLSAGAKVLGCTATPKRHDKRALGQVYATNAYRMGVLQGISQGWLCSASINCLQLESLDLKGVKENYLRGERDFRSGGVDGINARLEDDKTVYEIADITARESGSLKTAVYCGSVEEARKVANRLCDSYGIKAEWICGDEKRCPSERRRAIMSSFTRADGDVQVLCNVLCLGVGWDFPALEHIVMARPTKSRVLYEQIFGRGLRVLPGTVDFDGSDASTRKQAIQQSAKPQVKFTDLRDNSMYHRLVTPMDVLGGTYSLAVRDKAAKLANGREDADPIKILNEAEEKILEAERMRLARVKAQARYRKTKINLFNQGGPSGPIAPEKKRGARMVFGKHKGKPLCEIPSDYLDYGLRKFTNMPHWLRMSMKAELARREHNKAVSSEKEFFRAADPHHERMLF
jgi:superfamily II DNA or RNA helicase